MLPIKKTLVLAVGQISGASATYWSKCNYVSTACLCNIEAHITDSAQLWCACSASAVEMGLVFMP